METDKLFDLIKEGNAVDIVSTLKEELNEKNTESIKTIEQDVLNGCGFSEKKKCVKEEDEEDMDNKKDDDSDEGDDSEEDDKE